MTPRCQQHVFIRLTELVEEALTGIGSCGSATSAAIERLLLRVLREVPNIVDHTLELLFKLIRLIICREHIVLKKFGSFLIVLILAIRLAILLSLLTITSRFIDGISGIKMLAVVTADSPPTWFLGSMVPRFPDFPTSRSPAFAPSL